MLNVDTNIVVHAFEGSLTSQERRLLAEEPWGISAIVLWELAKLFQLRRIGLDLKAPDKIKALESIHTWPIDLAVARASTELDFRSDPADEMIAATSIVHGVKLLTRDKKIRRSKLVPLAISG